MAAAATASSQGRPLALPRTITLRNGVELPVGLLCTYHMYGDGGWKRGMKGLHRGVLARQQGGASGVVGPRGCGAGLNRLERHTVTPPPAPPAPLPDPCRLLLQTVGLGTFKAGGDEARGAVLAALKAGIRHIDTASIYKVREDWEVQVEVEVGAWLRV